MSASQCLRSHYSAWISSAGNSHKAEGRGEPNLSPKIWKINRGSSLHIVHPRRDTTTAHLP